MGVDVFHSKNVTLADWTGTVTTYDSLGTSHSGLASNLIGAADWNSAHYTSLSVAPSEIYSTEFYEPFQLVNTNSTLSSVPAGTWWLDPFCLPYGIGSGQINIFIADSSGSSIYVDGQSQSFAAATNNANFYAAQTLNTVLCIYQLDTGANTTRLTSVWSQQISMMGTLSVSSTGSSLQQSLTFSFPAQWDASGGCTYSSTGSSITTGMSTTTAQEFVTALTAPQQYVTGSKMVPVPFATTLPPGEYYMAIMISSSSSTSGLGTGGASVSMATTQSVLGMMEFVDHAYKRCGLSVSNSSTCVLPFNGSVASTSSSPWATLGTSDMRNLATPRRLVWNYCQSSY